MRHLAAVAPLWAALLLGGCGGSGPEAGTDTLVIFRAHSEEIIAEVPAGFRAGYKQRTGCDVDMTWPDPGGGGTRVLKRLQDKFHAGRYDVDVVFGGGMILEQMNQLGMLDPYRLPDEVLSAIPKEVAGQPLYDRQFHWYGAAVSTFGLIYNKTVLKDKDLPPIKDWLTMADPRFFGLVGAGDPSKSASVRKAYDIILQAYGYEKGMSILVRMGGYARECSGSSSEIPRKCA